jgi:peptide/nickel transport system substrate-binding protein
VGTGSYRLSQTRPDGLDLQPFPDGWRKADGLLPLTFVVEPDPARRVARLIAAEADLAADLTENAVGVLRGAPCCRELAVPGSTVEYLRLSRDVAPFRDRRVRQAIDLAIDRPSFVAAAHDGLGLPLGQLVVPGVFGFAPDLKPTRRMLSRARRLLAEAGFPDGFDVVLEHRPGRAGKLIASQLAEAGIRVKARESPWTELHPRLRRGEVGFYLGGVVAQTAEASDVLDGFVHTRDEVRGYGITNHSRYSNPKADALIEEAAASLEMTRRRELLKEAMRVVMADLFIIPIAGLYEVYGLREGIRFTPRLDRKLLGRELSRE